MTIALSDRTFNQLMSGAQKADSLSRNFNGVGLPFIQPPPVGHTAFAIAGKPYSSETRRYFSRNDEKAYIYWAEYDYETKQIKAGSVKEAGKEVAYTSYLSGPVFEGSPLILRNINGFYQIEKAIELHTLTNCLVTADGKFTVNLPSEGKWTNPDTDETEDFEDIDFYSTVFGQSVPVNVNAVMQWDTLASYFYPVEYQCPSS